MSKEGAEVRVLKGITDAANWQRGDFGCNGPESGVRAQEGQTNELVC